MKVRRVERLRGLALLVLLLGGGSACAQVPQKTPSENEPAPNVVAVRVVREDGSVLIANPGGLAVEIGKPLQRDQVAASIRTIYQTGDYADLHAVVTREAAGIRLDFVVRENLFINQVVIEGLKAPPSDASAAAAMQLSLGQTYRAADIDDAINRLREALREEGLYQAKVIAEPQPHPETHQMDVLVHVESGPRVRLRSVELLNNTHYPDAQLLKLFKLKPGSELTVARAQQGTERIRKYLEKRGHLTARVSVRRGEYSAQGNTLPLSLEVTEGPRFLVDVVGAKFSRRTLKKLIPVYQEGSVDTDLLEEGKRNLRERLEREGYFDATVDYATAERAVDGKKSEWKGSEEVITYRVNRGDLHKLLRIEFEGNRYFSTSLLRSLLKIAPNSYGIRPRFSRTLLDSDVLWIKSQYAANGFLSANVEGKIQDDFEGKRGDLVIRFVIQEGKQTLVSSLSVEGRKAISEEEIRRAIRSSPGQPYSDINVATDRDNILALYFNQGFPNAQFSWTAEPDKAPLDEGKATKGNSAIGESGEAPANKLGYHIERAEPMRLVYKIEEGPQIRVRRVLLAGYKRTRPRVIGREVKVKPDQPLREGDVVESQQKLYNLGIFNRVVVEPQNAGGTDPEKDVVVLVEEAKRYTIAYGGGFEVQRLASSTNPTGGELEASPRGILEISKQNLTGRADSLTLKLRGSTIQGRALLAYFAPNAFNNPKLSLQATAYAEKSQDINTFSQTRYEGNLQLTEQISSRSSILYRYAFRKVTVSNLNIQPDEIPLFNQPTLVSQFGVTWFRDTRDNPADATKGSFNSADASIADTKIGSSASFARFFFQNSTYTPIKRGWSFARSTRIGMLQPYRNTVSLTFPAPTTPPLPEVIPLPERFFAGGGTSLRGIALNQAGPRDADTGFPVGGQAVMIFNQELRFPLKLPFVGTGLGGTLFYDGGNTYSRLTRITFRWSPPDPVFKAAYPGYPPGRFNPAQCVENCSNELNYFSHTIGLGLRYATPVGPIRIDVGYALNRPQFVIPCKNGAVLCQEATRLPAIQFFFNLGSSF
ncbi:MAG TPA: POTRA domain-containing protein [Candidatus Acidoferrum sp.]|nr:POTRA domain-containing protein [Candidatus Acidoferrum sp.]